MYFLFLLDIIYLSGDDMKKIFDKWGYCFITIVSALVIITVIFILQDVAPFGENSLLTIDFYHQYGPMLGELFNRIHSGSQLIYSFNMGMGLPFFRNYFNYLSSPFNVIIFLFKHRDLLMSYSIIIGLKALASAITMSLFLKNKFGKNYMFIPLSLYYAFCAYFTAYYWNIMWIDGIVLLPLIALGIEKIVNENKFLFYIISLAVMLYTNYFIGYMTCIFSALYFFTYLIIKTDKFELKKIINKIIHFGLASIFACGLCAVFLIPLYFALRGISATNDVWPTSQYYDFTILEFIFNHFSGVGSTVLKSGITTAPNISVGIMGITLLFVFFANPKIELKAKLSMGCLLAIMILSFAIAQLDFIWHAFHVPNDLPYRYSFIYSFIIVVISAYGINSIKDIKTANIGIIYMLTLIFITIMKIIGYDNITNDMIIMNYIIVTVFCLCYVVYIYFNKYAKYALIFTIFTAILECIMVVNNNWSINHNISTFYRDYESMQNILNYVNNNDDTMYRIERDNMLTFNDSSWYNYYGQIAFSSMEYENMAILQYNLGMPGNYINSFYYKQNTPIYDLMFNLKYLIGYSKDIKRYSLYYENDNDVVYKINYDTSLIYAVNKHIKNWNNNFENPFLNQNDFIYKATGISDVLEQFDNIESEIVYENDSKTIVKYKVLNNYDNFYFYFDDYNIDFVILNEVNYYTNDEFDYYNDANISVYNLIDYGERYIINETSNDKYIEFYIGYNSYYNDTFYLYQLNNDKLNNAYNVLNNNHINISVFKEKYIKVNLDINEESTIYTSIPYDDGWDVYIDGKEVETISIANSLLGFDIEKGSHIVELKYHIPYLKIGLIISVLSLGGIVILVKLTKKYNI